MVITMINERRTNDAFFILVTLGDIHLLTSDVLVLP